MRTLGLVVIGLVLTSCASVVIPGQYALQTYNRQPLPLITSEGPRRVEMTAVDLLLNADGRCSITGTTESGPFTMDSEDSCSWSASGTVVAVVTTSDGRTVRGSLADDTLTLRDSQSGDVWAFRRVR